MSLPQKLSLDLMQTQWAAQLNPLIANAIIQGNAIMGVTLNANNPKTFATGLNRTQQGWFLIDNMANSVVWRTAPFNASTLTLEASADTTISIWVF